jgi:hypothetical protein
METLRLNTFVYLLLLNKRNNIMDYIITTENFKQYSKNLKRHLKEMGFDISLGATQNLLARTLDSKDYNTILPIIKKQEMNLKMFKQSLKSLSDFKEDINNKDNDLSSIYENSMLPYIKNLLKIYEATQKFHVIEPLLLNNIETFKKAQLSLYLDLMLTTIESFKFISTLVNEEMDLSFIQQMNENQINIEIKDNYFEPLSELILKVIEVINKSTTNYQENFKTIFISISSYGIDYLTKEELSGIMEKVSVFLMEMESKS